MSASLIAKLRKARQFNVEVGGRTFTCTRPTDADAVSTQEWTPLEVVRRFVVGWSLVEMDFDPGGGPTPEPFDRELWSEWIVDHPELWEGLAIPILDAYKAHAQAREGAAKN